MTRTGGLHRNLASGVAITAMAVLSFCLTASAQTDTPVLLFKYPNTINNTTGITNQSFLAQGPNGEFYDTDSKFRLLSIQFTSERLKLFKKASITGAFVLLTSRLGPDHSRITPSKKVDLHSWRRLALYSHVRPGRC
jgi:hypothetical protein